MLSCCILNACATTTDSSGPIEPPPKPTACAVFKPIYWSGNDTDATIADVKVHNAVWKALCEPLSP